MAPIRLFLLLAVSSCALACSAGTEAPSDDESAIAGTSVAFVGSWSRDDQSQREGIIFAANGTYVRDRRGSLSTAGKYLRETGTYAVAKKDDEDVLTLKILTSGDVDISSDPGPASAGTSKAGSASNTSVKPDESFIFEHVPGGTGVGGSRPANLLLQPPSSGFGVGATEKIFEQSDSWCIQVADCARLLDEKSYAPKLPASCAANPAACLSCNTRGNTCRVKEPTP